MSTHESLAGWGQPSNLTLWRHLKITTHFSSPSSTRAWACSVSGHIAGNGEAFAGSIGTWREWLEVGRGWELDGRWMVLFKDDWRLRRKSNARSSTIEPDAYSK